MSELTKPSRSLGQTMRSTAARWRKAVRRFGKSVNRAAGPPAKVTAEVTAETPRAVEQKAAALLELGRFAEAEAVAAEGLARFPDRPALAKTAATAASRQHDWAGVARWSSLLRDRFPDNKAGYQLGMRAARAGADVHLLEPITVEAARRFADEAWAARGPAQLAFDRRDWQAAVDQAEALRRRFPDDLSGYEIGVQALSQLRRVDEATALRDQGRRDLGDRPELARLAERLAKWAPFAADDERLRQDAEARPGDVRAALKYAVHTNKFARDYFGQPEETLRRLEAADARMPGQPALIAARAKVLIALSRTDEAETSLKASGLVGSNPDLDFAWADVAEARGDLDAAIARFTEAVSRFPDHLWLRIGLLRGLAKQVQKTGGAGRASAETAVAEALARFPDSEDLHDLSAWIASHAGDHGAALSRWKAALARFPDAARSRFSFRTRVLDASLALGEGPAADETGDARGAADTAASVDGLTNTEIVTRFQNLGSTVFGCEFGGVQRHFGVEPLHLLRWGSCPIDSLIELVDNDFEGFMDEADARLDVQHRPGGGDEYVIRSIRYRIRLDTFVPVTETPMEQVLVQIRRRNNFLTRKLREELARPDPADKTLFVYKAYDEHATDKDLKALAKAINRTGPNTLLVMRLANAAKPPGQIEWVNEQLMIGFLPDFGKTTLGIGQPAQNGPWLAVLTRANAMWDARRSAQAADRPASP